MTIEQLMVDAIDLHVHHAPDTHAADSLMRSRADALEAAKQARQMRMRAIVLKNHDYPTAPLATMVSQLVPEVKVFGSICLDYEVGGLNFHALAASAKLGARVVWMPTHSSRNSMAKTSRLTGVPPKTEGIFILNPEHKLVPEMGRILSLIKDYDMILATGHISPPEVFALVEKALAMGISKLVITHPLSHSSMDQSLSLEEQQRLGQMGAFIEHDYIGFLPNERRDDPKEMEEAIRAVGAEHCIMTTDLGQYMNPPAAEGMRMFIALLLKNGITEHEIELMAKVNPAKLLGLN